MEALDGHISRLKRFCHRHRGIANGQLSKLLICGNGEKPHRAVELVGDSLGLVPEVLRVPELPHLCEIDTQNRKSDSVPAVATVLPLLTGVEESDVPDLLDEVRRAPELPLTTRLLQIGWPISAMVVALCIAYSLVKNERIASEATLVGRVEIESKIEATEVRFTELGEQREWLTYLQQIESQSDEADWNRLFQWVTQSLPDTCRLNEYRVDADGNLLLDGTVLDESIVYEFIQMLRDLPEVAEVALKGMTPEDSLGSRFVIRLTTAYATGNPETGSIR